MRKIKEIIEDRKTRKDLQKRLTRLERNVASIKMSVEIAMESRISFLETNYTNLKKIKPQIEQICDDIRTIKDATTPIERNKDDKESIEIV
jgi:archaellum component FlaC